MRAVFRVPSLVPFLVLVCASRNQRATAQAVGPEFRVNTHTTNAQTVPSVASDSSGSFVVVWESRYQDGLNDGVFGQRYSSAGAPLGGEFPVNTHTQSDQKFPSVARSSGGSFVVVWQSSYQDGSNHGVFGQRYGSAGTPLGAEFQVNTYTTDDQSRPSVASDSGGNFVVVWQSSYQDGSFRGVFGQRYGSAGAPFGAEFRVNTYVTSFQRYPSVASDSGGTFVVVWQSLTQDGSLEGIFGQRYGSTGTPLGAEFRVNTYTTGYQYRLSVASDSAGNFVVVWESYNQDGSGGSIFGQRYGSAGAPLGGEFLVSTFTPNNQRYPSVASDSGGSFVVVWQSFYQDGYTNAVVGQRYSSAGAPLGAEFVANTYTTHDQAHPSVASDSVGHFVVVWQSDTQDGSGYGIFGQRFCPALSSVTISVNGTTSICPGSTGGTATVSDAGGGLRTHQWVQRVMGAMSYLPISGATGTSYQLKGSDFGGGAPGIYDLACLTIPECGSPTYSSPALVIVSVDGTPPTVTPPSALTATQTLCM